MDDNFEVNEETLKRDFPGSYTPPTYEPIVVGDAEWNSWANSIELKLSNQGKIILGLGGVVLITLMLTVMQGKVVITLVKANKQIIDALNGIINGPDNDVGGKHNVSYTEPQGKVDESKIEPLNAEELEELRIRMEASTKGTEEGLL